MYITLHASKPFWNCLALIVDCLRGNIFYCFIEVRSDFETTMCEEHENASVLLKTLWFKLLYHNYNNIIHYNYALCFTRVKPEPDYQMSKKIRLNQVFMKEIGTSRLVTMVNRNYWCNIFVSQVSFIFKHQSSKQCGMKEDWWTCAQNILIFFQIYNTENLFVTLLLKNLILFPITSVLLLAAV